VLSELELDFDLEVTGFEMAEIVPGWYSSDIIKTDT
jgi:hypothetical protein